MEFIIYAIGIYVDNKDQGNELNSESRQVGDEEDDMASGRHGTE